MTISSGDKPRNEQFLDALVEELRTMSDTEALEGENAEELVKLGERLLMGARVEAGKLRMAEAKRKLSVVPKKQTSRVRPTAAEARRYLESCPDLTLAARGLNELSDEDVWDLFEQARELHEPLDSEPKDREE
jgi:Flp pilus assembly protein CpaB